jgi:hypothetical protein
MYVCMHDVTLRRVFATTVEVEKQSLLHILSVFLAIVTQNAMRMRHIVICGLSVFKIFLHMRKKVW